jgi:hypothetical protein
MTFNLTKELIYMIDPVSAFAVVNAAFNGIKRAVEIGREVQDVYGQLSQWAGAASDLAEAIRQREEHKPGIFEKIGFAKNETAEAFDTMVAKQRLVQMEKDIYQMFLYGELQHLGQDGYKEFVQLRRSIKEKREKMIYNQMRRRQQFIKNSVEYGLLLTVLCLSLAFILWLGIEIYAVGAANERW